MSIVRGQWSLVFLLFFLSFLILTKFNIDPDFGWHMAYGETFLKTHEIIRADPFSWTMPNYEWGNSYFLYQILVAYIFGKFGFLFLGIVFGVIGAIAVLILSFKKLDFFKVAFATIGTVVARANLAVRPHTLSFLFFAVFLIFLEKRFFVKRVHIFLWFLFFALWANIHRAFGVGLLIFAAFLCFDIINRKEYRDRQKLITCASCLAASFLATFLTPFSFDLWKSGVFFDLTTFENLRFIAEWQSLVFAPPASIFLALTGVVFAVLINKKHKQIGPVWTTIGALLFSLAFVSATFAFFWAAIFVFIVCRHLEIKLNLPSDFWSKVPLIFGAIAAFCALFLNFCASFLESYDFENRLRMDGYPVKAISYLNQKGFTNGLFNNYEWGGFIDFRGQVVKVFIDGRMAGWRMSNGRSILGHYIAIKEGNCALANEYKIETVLTKRNSNLSCFSDWKIEYEDESAKSLSRG